MLYFRMILSMVISLYTSRVVLDVLGVSDYGVYGVVGGVIGMFSFLNASMSGATSRFITYELGRGDANRLQQTFSSAMIVHIGIAVIVLILCETVGLWFLVNKLVIPADAFNAALWVYQLSIISAMISITQVPYTACIISHEKMSIYAYIELINVSLKLAVVFLLQWLPGTKLIIYAILLVSASTIVAMIYRVYAMRQFKECRFKPVFDKTIIKPLLSFSGWDIYGNLCGMAFYQGTTFLLNIFFGVVTNAANSIANTVAGVLVGLSNNVTTAYRPHIIKQYARKDFAEMRSALNQGVTAVVLLSALISIPAFLEMPQIIRLWLGQEPPHTVAFCRILIVFFMMGQINAYCIIAIHATGKIKWLSFAGGTIYLLTVPSIWLAFKIGMNPNWAYYIHVAGRVIILITDIVIMRNLIPEIGIRRFLLTISRLCVAVVASFFITYWIIQPLSDGFSRILICGMTSTILLGILAYIIVCNGKERQFVIARISAVATKFLARNHQ